MSSVSPFLITATPSNAPIPAFTNATSINAANISNTTSTIVANFSYIIPYGQSQECDIYGPLCQTGSIVVGVNLTTTTTSTTLACSSYLTAQSNYLSASYPYYDGVGNSDMYGGGMLDKWMLNFGHSPECRSYAQEYLSGRYIVSGCGDQDTVISQTSPVPGDAVADNYPTQLPLGVFQRFSPAYSGTCCGNCSLDVSEVRLYYFPDSTTPDCGHNQSISNSTISERNLGKRVQSLVADGSTAVVSGHTFTSPSVYLQVLGTVAVTDRCTTVGPILTNPIMTFSPGGLSTWKPPSSDVGFNSSVGAIWQDPIGDVDEDNPGVFFTGSLAPLAVKDLACPTWGLGTNTSADGSVTTTIGPPWLPLIAPPFEAFSLDPTWALLCTGLLTDGHALTTFALFVLPIALTPESRLVAPLGVSNVAPSSVPASIFADPTIGPSNEDPPSTEVAKPASSPIDPADTPARTGASGPSNPSPPPAIASTDPAKSEPPPGHHLADPTTKQDPPSEPNVPQPAALSAVGALDPPPDLIVPSSTIADGQYDDPQNAPAGSKAPPRPALQGSDAKSQTQALGALIYNAFGKSGPVFGGNENTVNTIPVPSAGVNKINIGEGQVLSVDPSGATFQGKTYSIGGPVLTLSNSVYILVAEDQTRTGTDDDGQNRVILVPAHPDTLTIAGQRLVPNPTEMVIAGSSVLPGGSAVTISNTPISLDRSGILIVGSSSFSLPPQSALAGKRLGQLGVLEPDGTTISLPALSPPVIFAFTVAGQTFTPNPTAFSIAGTTIPAGGAAVTVGGIVVSLQPSGTLVVGSSTIALSAPQTPPPSLLNIDRLNIQAQRSRAIPTLTVAGQTFTPNPTAFSIAGTTISSGGAAVTVGGTVISLQPSGTLVVGSSTIALATPQTPPPSLLNIDGLSIEAQPSRAIVDGVTINPGAPGMTIDGNVVSLEAGGDLDIGTGRFAMPTEGANGSSGFVAFEGGQEKRVAGPLLLVLLFTIGGTLMTIM